MNKICLHATTDLTVAIKFLCSFYSKRDTSYDKFDKFSGFPEITLGKFRTQQLNIRDTLKWPSYNGHSVWFMEQIYENKYASKFNCI